MIRVLIVWAFAEHIEVERAKSREALTSENFRFDDFLLCSSFYASSEI